MIRATNACSRECIPKKFLRGCRRKLDAIFCAVSRAGVGTMFLGTSGGAVYRLGQGRGAEYRRTPRLDFSRDPSSPLAPLPPQFTARAKRVIYLHMAGAPSQLELFEHKPELTKLDGQDCPASFLAGKRFAFISGVPKLLGSQYPFHQAGQSGQWISDRLPHLEKHMDDLCFIKSMHTDQFNHAPAQLLVHTGNARLGLSLIGLVGDLRIGHGEPESSGLHRAGFGRQVSPTVANNFGDRAFCPVFIRACNAARTASRCFIWKTRRK